MNLRIKDIVNKHFSFDNEDKSVLTKKRVSNDLIVKPFEDALWIKDNFVDLGLPSGTLWCKYNLGATCEDTKESWYGHYYMWGSTKPNCNCCWEITPFNNRKKECDEEYFKEHLYELVDHNLNLLPEYDAAYQENHLMHIPTRELLDEFKTLPNKYVKNYGDIADLNGYEFTGKNNNTLFIPAAGWVYLSEHLSQGSGGYLWSSRLYVDSLISACDLGFYSASIFLSSGDRCSGFSIRPVLYYN